MLSRRSLRLSLCALWLLGCAARPTTPAPLPRPSLDVAAQDAAHDGPEVSVSAAATELEPSGRIAQAPEGEDRCFVADDNLARASRELLALRPPAAPAPVAPWDHRAAPRFDELVAQRFALTAQERAVAARAGFVVLGRQRYAEFASALHDVYQSQLPLYVSSDAVLHAVFKSHDGVLAQLEDDSLAPRTGALLEALAAALPAARRRWPEETGRDLEQYLSVARSLLRGERVGPPDPAVDALLEGIQAAASLSEVELYGRARALDFSMYAPRSHYADTPARQRYFRAAMWLSRAEFNLVSRGSRSSQPGATPDTRETPREALDALALAELLEASGQGPTLATLEGTWTVLAGRREDVSLAELNQLRAQAHLTDLRAPDAFARFRAALGDRFQRTARVHPMPEGTGVLPAITTLLGPRIVVDNSLLTGLVHDAVAGRQESTPMDVPCALGHARACERLAPQVSAYPQLGPALRRARAEVERWPRGEDLYSAWLGALRTLAPEPTGAHPSFMDTDEGRDLRLNSLVAGWAQLRHNYVLMVPRTYAAFGCTIPDAYLEPSVELYGSLAEYARRGRDVTRRLAALGAGVPDAEGYFSALAERFEVLQAIAAWERTGHPLPEPMVRFLSMVAESRGGGSDGPPTWTGWYYDLYRRREVEALQSAAFVADYFASTEQSTVYWAGASTPALGLFVVDAGGAPRWMVGPVATAFGVRAPLARPLNDGLVPTLTDTESPWAEGYTVRPPPAPTPPLAAYSLVPTEHRFVRTVYLASARPLPAVEVRLEDEHHVALATRTVRLGPAVTRVELRPGPRPRGAPALDPDGMYLLTLRVGTWTGTLSSPMGEDELLTSGGMAPLNVRRDYDEQGNPLPLRVTSSGCSRLHALEGGVCRCQLASGCEDSPLCPEGRDLVYVPAGAVQRAGRTERVPGFCVQRTESAVGEALAAPGESAGAACARVAQRAGEPRRCVSFAEARAACAEEHMRLPTEAQWLRMVGPGPFPWGAEPAEGARLNVCDRRCRERGARSAGFDDGFAGVAPAGHYLRGATPLGLLDLRGNVAEWLQSAEESDTPSGARLVVGGSYAEGLEVTRAELPVATRDPRVGFRCVLDPADAAQAEE